MIKKRRTYLPRIVGDKVMMPADLKRLHKYMLDVEHIGIISDEMRAVVEELWPSWYTSSRQKSGTDPREGNMRRVCLGISAISTFLFASCPENPANAMTLGDPSAMRVAIVDIAVTDRAHCRPGRVHHRSWPYDGCAQGYIDPSYYHYRYRHSRPSNSSPNSTSHSMSKSGSMGGKGGGHK
jgi:hypothetical protein